MRAASRLQIPVNPLQATVLVQSCRSSCSKAAENRHLPAGSFGRSTSIFRSEKLVTELAEQYAEELRAIATSVHRQLSEFPFESESHFASCVAGEGSQLTSPRKARVQPLRGGRGSTRSTSSFGSSLRSPASSAVPQRPKCESPRPDRVTLVRQIESRFGSRSRPSCRCSGNERDAVQGVEDRRRPVAALHSVSRSASADIVSPVVRESSIRSTGLVEPPFNLATSGKPYSGRGLLGGCLVDAQAASPLVDVPSARLYADADHVGRVEHVAGRSSTIAHLLPCLLRERQPAIR